MSSFADEISELPSAVARVHAGASAPNTVRVNRALASALAIRHRVRHSVEVRAKIPPRFEPQHSPEEKLLRSIFGETGGPPPEGLIVAVGARIKKWTRVIDHTEGFVSFAGADHGDVESVTKLTEGLPKDIGSRIDVVVTWPGPLEVGDVLYTGDAAIGIVEAIVEDGSGEPRVMFGAGGGSVTITRRLPTAEQAVEARAIGPYSLVSQRPITGQRVQPNQLAWLAKHGARALAGEFSAYKTGDVDCRVRVYEALVKQEPVTDPWSMLRPAPRPPAKAATSPTAGASTEMRDIFSFFEPVANKPLTTDSLRAIDAHLRVCGMGIALDGHDLRLELRMPDGARDEWTFGEVKKPETLNYRTLAPEPGGLFCQKIFGPVKDYECACGKYKRMKHRGIVCDTCGVEVIQSKVRRSRFGHFALPSPIVPRHLRRLVSALIGEPSRSWLATLDQDGGIRLREQLAAADATARARAFPASHRDRPLLEAFASSGVRATALAWTRLPVLPPDLRPLVALQGGRFATSDLNDLYRRVINRGNRTRRLMDLNAPMVILVNERRMMRDAVDQLLFNGTKGLPVVKFQKKPLMSLFKILKRSLRPDPTGIRCDFSAAATALVEDRTRVAMPISILFEITRPLLYGLAEQLGHAITIKRAKTLLEESVTLQRDLVSRAIAQRPMLLGNAEGSEVLTAAMVEIGDDPVIRLPTEIAKRIDVRTGSRVVAFLPLSVPGIEEARALAAGDVRSTPLRDDGWVLEIAATKRGAADRLVEMAAARAEDPCESAHAAFLVGGWVLAQ